jgi:hypothetical protein
MKSAQMRYMKVRVSLSHTIKGIPYSFIQDKIKIGVHHMIHAYSKLIRLLLFQPINNCARSRMFSPIKVGTKISTPILKA